MLEDEIKEQDDQAEVKDSSALTPNKALKSLQIILRFFQLLCENHNGNLQNTLREQMTMDNTANPKSFDFVSQVARIFIQYQKIFSQKTCNLGY